MISKERFREMLGARAKELSDKQLDIVRDGFYSLGYALLEWSKQHSEENLKECTSKKRKN